LVCEAKICHTFMVFIGLRSFLSSSQALSPGGVGPYARFLPSSLILSAIMAMNSELVGFPLVLDTVYPK